MKVTQRGGTLYILECELKKQMLNLWPVPPPQPPAPPSFVKREYQPITSTLPFLLLYLLCDQSALNGPVSRLSSTPLPHPLARGNALPPFLLKGNTIPWLNDGSWWFGHVKHNYIDMWPEGERERWLSCPLWEVYSCTPTNLFSTTIWQSALQQLEQRERERWLPCPFWKVSSCTPHESLLYNHMAICFTAIGTERESEMASPAPFGRYPVAPPQISSLPPYGNLLYSNWNRS